MLSPADADLARRDPAIPGLRLLLDAGAFAEALRHAAPEAEIGSAVATYAKYKPGTNCLVAYRMEIAGEPVFVHAKAWAAPAAHKLDNVRRQSGIAGVLPRGRLVLEDCVVAATVFPNDAKVLGLPALDRPTVRGELLSELFPERQELASATVTALAYKPERRYVGRIIRVGGGPGPAAVLKLYTDAGYAAACRAQPAPPLGRSDRYRALAFEWVPGRLLSDALAAHEVGPAEVRAVGEALVHVHQRDAGGLIPLSREGQIVRLLAEADTIGTLLPSLRARAHRLARRLASRLQTAAASRCAIHGDFHPRQVLTDGGGVTLIDFDGAVCADPMIDLGVFAASLERSAIRGTIPRDLVEPLRDALLTGYLCAGGLATPERVRLHTAVELLRLAPRFFRYCEPDWPERINAALRRVEELASAVPAPAGGSVAL